MERTAPWLLLPLVIGGLIAAAPAEAQVVEEVLAVVGSSPILDSDLRLAALVGLVDGATGDAGRSDLLRARVRLELQFTDLETTGTLFRLDLDVDAALDQLVERGGGTDAVSQRLANAGFSWDDVRDLAVRVAAVTAYVEQRLRPRIRVTPEELEAAYAGELVPRLESLGETPPPLPEVRDLLQRLVTERRLNEQIEEWLRTARTQHPVTVFRP